MNTASKVIAYNKSGALSILKLTGAPMHSFEIFDDWWKEKREVAHARARWINFDDREWDDS